MAASATQHGVNLPDAALPAWRAYCDMLNSKDAHFDLLSELGHKAATGGQRTLAEAARLGQLLQQHDHCVREFATAMRQLAASNHEAHGALVTSLATLNQSLGGPGTMSS